MDALARIKHMIGYLSKDKFPPRLTVYLRDDQLAAGLDPVQTSAHQRLLIFRRSQVMQHMDEQNAVGGWDVGSSDVGHPEFHVRNPFVGMLHLESVEVHPQNLSFGRQQTEQVSEYPITASQIHNESLLGDVFIQGVKWRGDK